MVQAPTRKVRIDRFSRLDIIDDHELTTMVRNGDVHARCSCGHFGKVYSRGERPATLEMVKDKWLFHVQSVRDTLRGRDADIR